jgi:hypothetical protein
MSDLRTFFTGPEPWTAAAPVEGRTVVGRDHLVEPSGPITARFDRRP